MHASNTSAETGFLPMSVKETAFLVDRLGQDCHPLQFVRELTQNAIEAVRRSNEPGQIVWDADRYGKDAHEKPVYKLSVIDTGHGMTADEMEQYVNQLSASGSLQVGARVSPEDASAVAPLHRPEGCGGLRNRPQPEHTPPPSQADRPVQDQPLSA